jgi:hypothetical protein
LLPPPGTARLCCSAARIKSTATKGQGWVTPLGGRERTRAIVGTAVRDLATVPDSEEVPSVRTRVPPARSSKAHLTP